MYLKKIALVTAISTVPFTVSALEALDDEFLGEITGQEGITIDQHYANTIEEFKYVDGDGDGVSGPGEISVTNIQVGASNQVVGGSIDMLTDRIYTTGMTIDASATGVLIGEARIGDDTTGTFVGGKDLLIGGIHLGNAAGGTNSIGSIAVIDQSNYMGVGGANLGTYDASGNLASGLVSVAGQKLYSNAYATEFGSSGDAVAADAAGDAAIAAMIAANTDNSWITGTTLISSKTSGTGVVISSDSFSYIGEVQYSDHENGGVYDTSNTIEIESITTFRMGDGTEREANNSGNVIMGAYSTMTIDVEAGKLVLSAQESMRSMTIDAIKIGGTSVGSVAILGNHWVGTTSIYAH